MSKLNKITLVPASKYHMDFKVQYFIDELGRYCLEYIPRGASKSKYVELPKGAVINAVNVGNGKVHLRIKEAYVHRHKLPYLNS